MSAKQQSAILAVTSDHHVRSTLGLCPPEGVRLDDGGQYAPSKAQRWTWDCWEEFWAAVAALRKRHRAKLYCAFNGDLFDGQHHGSTQTISNHPEVDAYLAERAFGVPKALEPDRVWIMRGTEAHVGPSGASEEAFARSLGAERDREHKRRSFWHLRRSIHGIRCDFQHHGRMGQRPWTEQNVVSNLAAQIFYEHASRGLDYPHLAFRSHFHRYKDSHDAHPSRVIQTPAWQLKTAYAHKVVPESLADIGGIMVLVEPDGAYQVTPKLYRPEVLAWKPA